MSPRYNGVRMTGNHINIHVGKRLRERRTMLGLSQEAVGDGVGVASQQVQKYEKGTNVMNAIRLYEFAQFLKVPVAYFYEGLEETDGRKAQLITGVAEEAGEFEGEFKGATDREALELLKSFKRIRDHATRKRVSDLVRTISIKGI